MSLDMSPPPVPVPVPSASTISTTVSTGTHVIKFNGYSHAKALLGTGECVKSAVFKAAGHSWRLNIYPNGASEELLPPPGSIALYLVLVSKSKHGVHAKFRFSLMPHGSKLTSSSAHDDDVGRATEAPVVFNAGVEGLGFHDVGTNGELEKPEYLKDDTVLIRCDITVLNEPAVERHDLKKLNLPCDCNDDTEKKASQSSHVTVEEMPPPPSGSTITVTASTGCHVIKVSGYSQAKQLIGNGNHIKSAAFMEAGHTWLVRCYPNGDREDTAGHISLYLEFAGYSMNVHAKHQFSLVPQGQLTAAAAHGGRGGRNTFGSNRVKNCFGFKDFMAREELEKSKYLKDDCFYIRCDITAMDKPVAKLRDPEALGLLCCCSDDACKNIHGRGKMGDEAAGKRRRCLGLRRMLLSCFPVRGIAERPPLFVLVLVISVLVFWRKSSIGIVSLSMMSATPPYGWGT